VVNCPATTPRIVRETIEIPAGASLTLGPCSQRLFASGAGIVVDGILNLSGEVDQPVRLEPLEPGAPWAGIVVARGRAALQHAIIDSAGAVTGSALSVYKAPESISQQVYVNDLTIQGSAETGLTLGPGVEFAPDSRDLVITGSRGISAKIGAGALTRLPAGHYQGNGIDEIEVSGGTSADFLDDAFDDVVIHDRGVPYRMAATTGDEFPGLRSSAKVSIEPGVVLRFPPGGALVLGERLSGREPDFWSGTLIAVGTAERPIVLTSSEPTPRPGAWRGLFFPHTPRPGNRLEHVRIEYAGGEGAGASCPVPTVKAATAAGAVVFPDNPPAAAFIRDSTIAHSAGHGIVRGWPADSLIDLAPGNQFTDVAWCQQSYPQRAGDPGACPPAPPCAR
jgi:hypothetical protein